MKVLIVVRTLKIGGMERVAVNLADAFAEQGHESHLMYFKPRPPQLAPNNEQVNVHHFALSHAMWASGVGGGIEIAARLFNSVLRKSYFLLSGWWGGKLFSREIRRLERQYGAFDRIIFRGIGTFETVWSFQDPRLLCAGKYRQTHFKSCWLAGAIKSTLSFSQQTPGHRIPRG